MHPRLLRRRSAVQFSSYIQSHLTEPARRRPKQAREREAKAIKTCLAFSWWPRRRRHSGCLAHLLPASQPMTTRSSRVLFVHMRLHSYKLVRAFFVGCFSRGRKYRASSPWLDAVGPAATTPVVAVWAAVMTKFILSESHPFGVEEPRKRQSNSFTLDVPRFGKTG